MRNRVDRKKVLLIVVDVLLFIALVGVMIWSTIRDRDRAAELQALAATSVDEIPQVEAEPPVENNATVEENNQSHENVVTTVGSYMPGIVCWGDSLTAGVGGDGASFPSTLQTLINDNICTPYNTSEASGGSIDIPVINMGVGGESSITIAGRNGAIPFVVSEAFSIPQDTKPVTIKFTSKQDGQAVAPLRQGSVGMEKVTIDGVDGVIEVTQESAESEEFSYTFSRTEEGTAKEVSVDTPIITSGSQSYKNYIPILFIGQNGGWDANDPQTLIDQQNTIIADQTQNNDRYIILGLTTGNAEERSELEAAMVASHGDRYINLRAYLSGQAIQDAGIQPTEDDNSAMAVGSVPPSLISSGVHLNAKGYELVGDITYKRMESLGYFAEIIAATTEKE